jgi:hypothetical protein
MRAAMRALLFLIVGALLVGLGAAPARAQQEAGTIVGQVTNGTAGAPTPADVEVVVHVLQNRVKVGERRVRTDGTGAFTVDGLPTGADTLYFPIVQYGGVAYYPDRPVAPEQATSTPVEITVFETTATADAISFDRLNMLVMGVTPTALTIMEMGAVVNAGDRTFAADPVATGSARTLRFNLPPGAIQVTPQAGLPADTLESTPDGFATTDPVRPGRREIAYSYQLPYSVSTIDFARSFALPVGTFTLYVPNDVGTVVGPGMAFRGTADLGGRQYRQYVVERVAPGTEARFRLTDLPAPLFARPRDLGLVVAGVAAAALLVGVSMAIRRRVRQAPSPAAGGREVPSVAVSAAVSPDAERLALVKAVAELDERFAAGGLDPAAYDAERARQKAKIVALTRSSAGAR